MVFCEYIENGVRKVASTYGTSFGCPIVPFNNGLGVRLSDIAQSIPDDFRSFTKWMNGRTMSGEHGGCVYLHDWENWKTR
jgi:hypothetical protein